MNDDDNNLYAPPDAAPASPAAALPPYYVVSLRKLTVLYLMTVGMYQLWWYYRNWALYRAHSGERIWPVPRAIFAVFFVHGLFRGVQARLVSLQRKAAWNPTSLATTLVILMVLSHVLDRASWRELGSPWTDMFSLLILVPLVLAYREAQAAINLAAGDPQGQTNSTYTWANWVWIVIGGIFWSLILVGTVLLFRDGGA